MYKKQFQELKKAIEPDVVIKSTGYNQWAVFAPIIEQSVRDKKKTKVIKFANITACSPYNHFCYISLHRTKSLNNIHSY